MNNQQRIGEDELARRMREIKAEAIAHKSLGFYLHLLFMAGAGCTVVMSGAWSVLWALLLHIPLMAFVVPKTFFWNWTEKRLCEDANAGRTVRAVYWDYLSVAVDWTIDFLDFSIVALCVFTLAAGYGMASTSVWLCVAGMYTMPLAFMRKEPGYHWGNYVFWTQWTVVVILVASAFRPIGPAWGIAIQAAVATISIPLACAWKHKSIVGKVERYRADAVSAKARNCAPPPPAPTSPIDELCRMAFADANIERVPFIATAAALVAGIVWLLLLHHPYAIIAALVAIPLGYVSQSLTAHPGHFSQEDIDKRGLDVDLLKDLVDDRAVGIMMSLAAASMVILWLGGRGAAFLAALSLLAVGACNITAYVSFSEKSFKGEWLSPVVYALAFASVCALRILGLRWWQCLAPIPALAYLMPVLRWFFPKSGLRGAERRAAIAEMPQRLKTDIRSDSEKIRDEKAEKRRRRNERRIANFRRSRGG